MTVNLTSSAIYTIKSFKNYQRRKLPVIRNQDGKYLLTKQDLKPSCKHEEKLCKVHWPTSTKLFCWKLLLWKVALTDIKGFEKWKGQSYFSSQIMTKLIWETPSRVKKEEVDNGNVTFTLMDRSSSQCTGTSWVKMFPLDYFLLVNNCMLT